MKFLAVYFKFAIHRQNCNRKTLECLCDSKHLISVKYKWYCDQRPISNFLCSCCQDYSKESSFWMKPKKYASYHSMPSTTSFYNFWCHVLNGPTKWICTTILLKVEHKTTEKVGPNWGCQFFFFKNLASSFSYHMYNIWKK